MGERWEKSYSENLQQTAAEGCSAGKVYGKWQAIDEEEGISGVIRCEDGNKVVTEQFRFFKQCPLQCIVFGFFGHNECYLLFSGDFPELHIVGADGEQLRFEVLARMVHLQGRSIRFRLMVRGCLRSVISGEKENGEGYKYSK